MGKWGNGEMGKFGVSWALRDGTGYNVPRHKAPGNPILAFVPLWA